VQLRLAKAATRPGCRSQNADQADVELEGAAAADPFWQVLKRGVDEFLQPLLRPLVLEMIRPVVDAGPRILAQPGQERHEHLACRDAVGQRAHQQPHHRAGIRLLALVAHAGQHLLPIRAKTMLAVGDQRSNQAVA
jgi:hypothetical protein